MRVWTYSWCNSAPQGSWWTPGELPACDSAALQPPSSDAGRSVGSRNRGTYPNLAHIAPHLKTRRRQDNQESWMSQQVLNSVLCECMNSLLTWNSYQFPNRRDWSNFHCKIVKELTGLTEVSSVRWQTETLNLPVSFSASASIETGVVQTGIWNKTERRFRTTWEHRPQSVYIIIKVFDVFDVYISG